MNIRLGLVLESNTVRLLQFRKHVHYEAFRLLCYDPISDPISVAPVTYTCDQYILKYLDLWRSLNLKKQKAS